MVHGQILGFNYFDELIPVVWAEVTAWSDGELVTRGYSGGGGYYAIILPVGHFTLQIEEPGYKTISREIFVSSGSSSTINFYMELSYEPVYKPKTKPPALYVFRAVVTGLPSDVKTSLFVDGILEAELADGESVELEFDVDTVHNVSVKEKIERDGERYITDVPSIIVSSEAAYAFRYNAEYYLSFSIKPEELPLPIDLQAGWYPAGTTITTPTAASLIDGPLGARYLFETWGLDGYDREENPLIFTMDRPHSLTLLYSEEYLVEVSSPYGTPEGSGWYTAGSTAIISIQQSEGLLLRHIFVEWTGDYRGIEPTAQITVNKPLRINAIWTFDYTPILIIIALVAICIAAIGIILKLRKS